MLIRLMGTREIVAIPGAAGGLVGEVALLAAVLPARLAASSGLSP